MDNRRQLSEQKILKLYLLSSIAVLAFLPTEIRYNDNGVAVKIISTLFSGRIETTVNGNTTINSNLGLVYFLMLIPSYIVIYLHLVSYKISISQELREEILLNKYGRVLLQVTMLMFLQLAIQYMNKQIFAQDFEDVEFKLWSIWIPLFLYMSTLCVLYIRSKLTDSKLSHKPVLDPQ